VILISGIGLILLSMTNRFGRIHRTARRILTEDLRRAPRAAHGADSGTVGDPCRPCADLARRDLPSPPSVCCLQSILVISLFLGALLELSMAAFIVILFVLCMLSLIVSLLMFILDLRLSLEAFWLEMPARLRRGK